MKRLLLLSNSTNFKEPFLQYPQNAICNFLGNQVREVLFVPYAGVTITYEDYGSRVSQAFNRMGYQVQNITATTNPVEAVSSCQAIAIGGGNTFELLNQLYTNDLMDIIRRRVEGGLPFIGWSAGSNVAGPSIKTTNDMPIVEPPSFDALNLVPFQINPHYTEERLPNHGGEGRPDRINEFTAKNPGLNVIGVPEGNMLKVEGGKLQLIGPDKITVFHSDKDPSQFSHEESLDFLMN